MYAPFMHQPDLACDSGWDAYAENYAQLLVPDTIYHLTKDVIHRQLDDLLGRNASVHVLDLNCGVGNDFPFFLARGWKITGCDGSAGMLNKAWERFQPQIESGQISLFQGQMESLDANSFPGRKYHLIFSVTGGYSYIADEQVRAANETLGDYLTPGGLMVTAHLTKFCPAEMGYHLLRGRLRQAFVRLKRELTIQIKGQPFRMFLRGPGRVAQLTPSNLELVQILPLLWLTPPYQTGCHPPIPVYRLMKFLELATRSFSCLAPISDQAVAVLRRKGAPGIKDPIL